MDHHTVTIFNDGLPNPTIATTITTALEFVDFWIHNAVAIVMPPRLFGLGLEMADEDGSVATIQLCYGHKCLIYRMFPSATFSETLIEFLIDPDNTLLGFGLRPKILILMPPSFRHDVRYHDLGFLLSSRVGNVGPQETQRDDVVKQVLENVDVYWPKPAGRWDMPVLSYEQARYACIRAFIPLQMGMLLFRGDTLLYDILIRVLLGD